MHTRQKLMSAVCAVPLLAASAGLAMAAPIAKHCGPKDKYVIAFSQANYAEPYRQHVNNDLIERVKAIPQFELQIADGAGNDNTQTSQVDNFVTQGVDLLLISPFEAAPLTPAIKRAMDGFPRDVDIRESSSLSIGDRPMAAE